MCLSSHSDLTLGVWSYLVWERKKILALSSFLSGGVRFFWVFWFEEGRWVVLLMEDDEWRHRSKFRAEVNFRSCLLKGLTKVKVLCLVSLIYLSEVFDNKWPRACVCFLQSKTFLDFPVLLLSLWLMCPEILAVTVNSFEHLCRG